MNEEIQLHFEDVDPAGETVVHARTNYGDDIDEQSSHSIDGNGLQDDHSDDYMDLQDDRDDDAATDSSARAAPSVDDIELQGGPSDDATGALGEQADLGVDDIDPQDNHGDDAAAYSGEQAVPEDDDIDLQKDYGDDVVMPDGDQAGPSNDVIDHQAVRSDDGGMPSGNRGAVESVAWSSSVQEPDDEGPGSSGRTMGVDLANDRRVMAMETQGWRYPISHLVFDYRQMTDEEFSGLVEDIKKKGLACPITRWRGEIIDGVHRLLACLEAGVEPVFEDLDDDADPEGHIESKNDKRRHLTFGERAEAAAKRSTRSKRGRPRLPDAEKSANLRNKSTSLTQEEAAKSVKISARSVSHGVRVFSSDSSAIPELQQAVREDTISVSDASRVVHETPEVQRKAVQLVASGESRTAVDGVRLARRASGPPCWKDADVVSPVYEKDGICIHRVGVGDLISRLEAGSADVVICASTAPDESGDRMLGSAAMLACHVLSNEGILILAADPGRLPQQLARVTQRKNLEWICQVQLVFESAVSNTGEPHYIEQRCITLLLFGKSGARFDGGDDVIFVPPKQGGFTNHPKWIEHAAGLIISRFVKPDLDVCFPDLSVGNSHLLIAAAKEGCKIIAADSDQSRIGRVVEELSKLPTSPIADDSAGT